MRIKVTYWQGYCDTGTPARNITLYKLPFRYAIRAMINSALLAEYL